MGNVRAGRFERWFTVKAQVHFDSEGKIFRLTMEAERESDLVVLKTFVRANDEAQGSEAVEAIEKLIGIFKRKRDRLIALARSENSEKG
jgi:hypothetical protein